MESHDLDGQRIGTAEMTTTDMDNGGRITIGEGTVHSTQQGLVVKLRATAGKSIVGGGNRRYAENFDSIFGSQNRKN